MMMRHKQISLLIVCDFCKKITKNIPGISQELQCISMSLDDDKGINELGVK